MQFAFTVTFFWECLQFLILFKYLTLSNKHIAIYHPFIRNNITWQIHTF